MRFFPVAGQFTESSGEIKFPEISTQILEKVPTKSRVRVFRNRSRMASESRASRVDRR